MTGHIPRCACKGRDQGRHDLLCEQVLRAAFGSIHQVPEDVLNLMREKGRILLSSPEVPDGAPLGLLREILRETLEEHPYRKVEGQYLKDRTQAWDCADDCDTCWFLLTDTALEELGDEVTAVVLRDHLASGHAKRIEEILPGGEPGMREQDKRRADAANTAKLATVGEDLMRAYNKGKTDPSDMATHGHDTTTGYEFFITRDGATIRVALTRDLVD